jgi:putative permease
MKSPDRERRLKQQHWIKLITFLFVLIITIVGVVVIDDLLLSLVIAIMVSYVISPLVSYLEATGMSRLIAIVAVYIVATTLSGLAIWAVTPFILTQLSALRVSAPDYVDGTVRLFDSLALAINNHSGGMLNIDLRDSLHGWLTTQAKVIVDGLPSALSSSASVLFLSPILGFFILKDSRIFARGLLRLVPNSMFELVLNVQHQISQQIAQYIRARLLESLIVGLVCLIGFLIIPFPYAFLLALFAAIANLIPYVGPLIGAAPGIILALINQEPSFVITMVVLVYVVAQIIDNFVIIPLVLARIVNLHPLAVILVVILGAQFMGILGMLISIPVASALKVTFSSVYNHLTEYSG